VAASTARERRYERVAAGGTFIFAPSKVCVWTSRCLTNIE
jgi:hypothetical protein